MMVVMYLVVVAMVVVTYVVVVAIMVVMYLPGCCCYDGC